MVETSPFRTPSEHLSESFSKDANLYRNVFRRQLRNFTKAASNFTFRNSFGAKP
ncbi:hypothetical protein PGTUg99_015766 [Puccinia graminis f. sp. tritici]|uniref:Uncharacterized protein n=1 Tax=Puccinia graminis f. sp. tritici TaxID=56615 RepID=A0A5B0NZY3_PUCGR|nr:hypothetical protein PGTUg99_015766 [Puccinia graminis f. sp. tritici]